MVGGEGDYIPIAAQQHCHHQKGFCIKLGSNESRFNVPLIVRDKLQDSVHRLQPLKRKESRSGFVLLLTCLTPYR